MEIPIFDDFPNENPALFSGGSMSSRPLPERQDPDRWSPRPGIDGKKDIFFTKNWEYWENLEESFGFYRKLTT